MQVTFNRGHCFMVETLNKAEVEEAGEILTDYLLHLERSMKTVPDAGELLCVRHQAKRLREILRKMDFPEPELI